MMAQSNEPMIEQMNEAIALFDGWKLINGDPTLICPSCDEGKAPSMYCICDQKCDRFQKDGKMVARTYFRYHVSWDYLKPVIDEIFCYALAHPEEVRPVREMSIVVSIQAAHEKVYKFCKWFNEQKQTNG